MMQNILKRNYVYHMLIFVYLLLTLFIEMKCIQNPSHQVQIKILESTRQGNVVQRLFASVRWGRQAFIVYYFIENGKCTRHIPRRKTFHIPRDWNSNIWLIMSIYHFNKLSYAHLYIFHEFQYKIYVGPSELYATSGANLGRPFFSDTFFFLYKYVWLGVSCSYWWR
jgi:hypothetical protein